MNSSTTPELAGAAGSAPPASAPPRDVVAAMFEDRQSADHARDALIAAGIAAAAIQIVEGPAPHGADPHTHSHGIWARIRERFVAHPHAHGYAEAVERGHAMLFVDAPPDRQPDVMALLEANHPIDVMRRVAEWHQGGWSGIHRSQAASPPPVERPHLLFQDTPEPDHMRSTGLINEHAAPRGVGAPLTNPMGIEIEGMLLSGSSRVRRYQLDTDFLVRDDL